MTRMMRIRSSFLVGLVMGLVSCEPTNFFQANVPGNVNNNNNINNNNNNNGNTNTGGGLLSGALLNRQVGGISFAIPGLSLLAGGNNGVGGGNLFGVVTVTRTLVSTVTTVTAPAFRTCTTSTAALSPCAGRRRRRDAISEPGIYNNIEATPVMELIIGSTTLRDRQVVSEYLEAHKPPSQSVIFPPGIQQQALQGERVKINPRLEEVVAGTTLLYPSHSHDTPEEDDATEESPSFNDDTVIATTETPELKDDLDATTSYLQDDLGLPELARVGLGRTTTTTTIIRVTSVATSFVTGTTATLTINYGGCMPQSLPVSGLLCT